MSATGSVIRDNWWVPTSGGHQLHVLQAHAATGAQKGIGILCLHGIFSDGRFFLGSSETGPARYFIDEGCAVYIAELRGHGESRWPQQRAWNWSFDEYAQHDVPDLIYAVQARHQGPLFLLAHSMAGYTALAGLGLRADTQQMLHGVCALSSAVNDYSDGGISKGILIRTARIVAQLLGRFPARALKQGTTDEPAALMRQLADWAATGGFCSLDGDVDYWQALQQVTIPVLLGVGAADVFHASPQRANKLMEKLGSLDKTLMVCGRAQGFGTDYGHFNILRGHLAQQEILPKLHQWMQAHI